MLLMTTTVMTTTMDMIIAFFQVTTMVTITTTTMNLGMKLYRPHSSGKVENKNSPKTTLPFSSHVVTNFMRLSLTLATNQGLKQMKKHLSVVHGLLIAATGVLMMKTYLSP